MTTPTAPDDWDYVRERARESYLEVLDATKHQDDKIGRFVAGIAFLVAAALVFLDKGNVLQTAYRIGDRPVRLAALAMAAFLVLITLALLLYLIASSAPLTAPAGRSSRQGSSHLFFFLIAGLRTEAWEGLWKAPSALPEDLAAEYRNEAMNIAQRAHAKYRQSQQATALFIAALVFFAWAGILTVHRLATGNLDASPPDLEMLWTWPLRWALGLFTASVAFVLYYQEHEVARFVSRVFKSRQEAEEACERLGARLLVSEVRAGALRMLMVAVPAAILLLIVLPVTPRTSGIPPIEFMTRAVLVLLGVAIALAYRLMKSRPTALVRPGGGWLLYREVWGAQDDRSSPRLAPALWIGAAGVVAVAYSAREWMIVAGLALALRPLASTLWSPHRDRKTDLQGDLNAEPSLPADGAGAQLPGVRDQPGGADRELPR